MTDKYILTEDHQVVPEPDLFVWARWFESADRHVAETLVGPYRVSTVFLGLDHDFGGVRGLRLEALGLEIQTSRPPLIFETMVFDNSREESSPWFSRTFHPSFHFQRRYRSWGEAKSGHEYAEKIAGRMLRWMEFRSLRETAEVGELNRLLNKS